MLLFYGRRTRDHQAFRQRLFKIMGKDIPTGDIAFGNQRTLAAKASRNLYILPRASDTWSVIGSFTGNRIMSEDQIRRFPGRYL